MGKLPAYLHYAKDWLTDVDLGRCSKAARGVWQDLLDVMFLNSIRGVCCTAGGEAWSDDDLAKLIGGDTTENLRCITELLSKGVAHRDNRGAIFSRRMVRDEEERTATKDRVRRFRGNGHVTYDVTTVKRSCTGTANETENANETGFGSKPKPMGEKVIFDEQQATSFVFLEVGLAGNEARMIVNDAVKSFIHNNECSPKKAAESLVMLWRKYEAAEVEFKCGVFKFFKQGLWKSPEQWGRTSGQVSKTKQRVTANRTAIIDGLGLSQDAGPSGASGGPRTDARRSPALVGDVRK